MDESTCKHCRERIVLINAGSRNEYWTHQPAGASFMDHTHNACRRTVATPAEDRGVRADA